MGVQEGVPSTRQEAAMPMMLDQMQGAGQSVEEPRHSPRQPDRPARWLARGVEAHVRRFEQIAGAKLSQCIEFALRRAALPCNESEVFILSNLPPLQSLERS